MKYITIKDGVDCDRCDGTGFMDSFDPDGLLDSVIKCNADRCESGIIFSDEFQITLKDFKALLEQ